MQFALGSTPPNIEMNRLTFLWKKAKEDPEKRIKMTESQELWRDLDFNKTLVIFCPGWRQDVCKFYYIYYDGKNRIVFELDKFSNVTNTFQLPDEIQPIVEAFLSRADVNFVVK